MAQPGKKLLCLHGYTQDGATFRSRTGSLRSKALKSLKCEYEFVDAMHYCSPTYILAERGVEEQKGWFNPIEDDRSTRPVDSRGWVGWDESLAMLRHIVEKEDFIGILGFSQGAAVAGLLAALYPHKFCFIILVSGFTPLDEKVDALYPQEPIHVPSLHIMGTSDPLVSIERSAALAEKFVSPRVLVHDAGHVLPPKELLKDIKEWIESLSFDD